jgi:D-hexose-6-phosphate mutarotase
MVVIYIYIRAHSCQLNQSLHLQKGSSAEILLYGATVISWKCRGANDDEPVERLFVSSKAFLDGSKAVRGGIPVVFPFFGAPTRPEHSQLPQHGYARTSNWKWDGSVVMDNDAGVSVRLSTSRVREDICVIHCVSDDHACSLRSNPRAIN